MAAAWQTLSHFWNPKIQGESNFCTAKMRKIHAAILLHKLKVIRRAGFTAWKDFIALVFCVSVSNIFFQFCLTGLALDVRSLSARTLKE